MSNSPIHMTKFDSLFSTTGNSNNAGANPIGINSVSSTNSNVKNMDQNILSPSTPQQTIADNDEYNNSSGGGFIPTPLHISKDATPIILAQWLNMHRLGQYVSTFAQFSGADLFRMSKEDLMQICGLADGIRLYNTLHSKWAKQIANCPPIVNIWKPLNFTQIMLFFRQGDYSTVNHLCELRW